MNGRFFWKPLAFFLVYSFYDFGVCWTLLFLKVFRPYAYVLHFCPYSDGVDDYLRVGVAHRVDLVYDLHDCRFLNDYSLNFHWVCSCLNRQSRRSGLPNQFLLPGRLRLEILCFPGGFHWVYANVIEF